MHEESLPRIAGWWQILNIRPPSQTAERKATTWRTSTKSTPAILSELKTKRWQSAEMHVYYYIITKRMITSSLLLLVGLTTLGRGG